MPATEIPGRVRMRELAAQFPDQLRDGFHSGRQLGPTVSPKVRQIALVGMGGSAIAGDLLGNVTEPETDRTVAVVRSPDLPRAIDRDWLVVCASYSGGTWETIAAFEEAGRRSASRIVVSSGGRLSELAADEGVPCLVVPAGLPPRSAVGYMLGGLLGACDPIFPESNEARLHAALHLLESRRRRIEGPKGAPAALAHQLGSRSPYIYAETGFGGLARRWKTQVEENAKRLAHFDLLPELFHNALVPWDAISPREAARRGVVLLEWARQDPRIGRRFRYLERLVRARGACVTRVRLGHPDRLASLLEGVWWGDFVSLELADMGRVDPFEVHAITRMKSALAHG
ncbi:MAG: SIS domain-containing protein [Thermoplasmata archaeon]